MSGPHHRTELTRESKGKQLQVVGKVMLASQISSDSKVISICGHVGSTGCGSTMQGGVKTNGNHWMYYLWLGIGFSREKCREPILTVTKKKVSFFRSVVCLCTVGAGHWRPAHQIARHWWNQDTHSRCDAFWVVGPGMSFLVLDLGGTYVSTVWCRFCWC